MKIYAQNNSVRFEDSLMGYNVSGCSVDVDLNDSGLLFLNHSIKLFGSYRFNYSEIEDGNGVFFTSYIDVLTYLNGLLTACNNGCDCESIISTLDSLGADLTALDGRVTQNEIDIAALQGESSNLELELQNRSLEWFNFIGESVTQNYVTRYNAFALATSNEITVWITDDGTQNGALAVPTLVGSYIQVSVLRNTILLDETPIAYVRNYTPDLKGIIIRLAQGNSGTASPPTFAYSGLSDNVNGVIVFIEVKAPIP